MLYAWCCNSAAATTHHIPLLPFMGEYISSIVIGWKLAWVNNVNVNNGNVWIDEWTIHIVDTSVCIYLLTEWVAQLTHRYCQWTVADEDSSVCETSHVMQLSYEYVTWRHHWIIFKWRHSAIRVCYNTLQYSSWYIIDPPVSTMMPLLWWPSLVDSFVSS